MSDHYSHHHSDCDNPMFQDNFNSFSKSENQDWSSSSPDNAWTSSTQSPFSSSYDCNTQALSKLQAIPLPKNMSWVSHHAEPMIEFKENPQGCALAFMIFWTLGPFIGLISILADILSNRIEGTFGDNIAKHLEDLGGLSVMVGVGIFMILKFLKPYFKPTYIYFNLQNQTIEVIKDLKKRDKSQALDLSQVTVDVYTTGSGDSYSRHLCLKLGEQKIDILKHMSYKQAEQYPQLFQALIHAAQS